MPRASRTFAWSVAVVLVCGSATAQVPVGTAFTYQGRLADGASPATGSYDFRFTLFDAAAAGNVVGSPVSVNGVVVTQGLFQASLDFGAAAFVGQARFLQVEVRPAGGGAYTPLAPRQELTSSPYALFSSRTDPANLTILNATNLTSGTVPDARLSGTYGSALSLTNSGNAITGTFTGDGAGLTNLNAQPKYKRTVVVGPVGTDVQNGTALLAALAGISASPASPWLLKVEPGTYDLGAASLVMKPFVDVEGSGEAVTKVTGTGFGTNAGGTIQAVTNAELRDLTAENRGGAAYAKALWVASGAPSLSHVRAVAFGGTTESQGLFVEGGATPVVRDVTASANAAAPAGSFGVINIGSSAVYFGLQAYANGGNFAVGIGNYNGAMPTIRGAVAIASGAVTENQGIATNGASPTLENVVGIATGAATNNLGCLSFGATVAGSLRNGLCRGIGATGINYGALTNGGANMTIVDLVADAAGGTTAHAIENNGAGGGTTVTHGRATAGGGTTESVGVLNVSCSPRIVDVEAFANSPTAAQAFRNQGGSPSLLHVTATATTPNGTGLAIGIWNQANASTLIEHASVRAAGFDAYGIFNTSGPGVPVQIVDAVVWANGANTFTVGVNSVSASVTLQDASVTAAASQGTVVGVFNDTAAARLRDVVASASGSPAQNYGLANSGNGTSTTLVDRSTFTGTTGSLFNGNNSTLRLGASQVVGAVVTNPGSITSCVQSYNGSYSAVNATCQ